ncbi:FAD-binding protein, partial [Treponema berlinense]|uniref:FAD-binding protein n=1 Tax=Treponema berlinense TaxID=225004 RepID=UPI0026ED737D
MNTADLADLMEAFTQNKDFCGEIKKDENLSPYCTMHTGGRAKAFIEVFDEKSLAFAVKTASLAGQKFFLLGGGSNVILPDEGLELVICTRKLGKDSPVSLSKKGVIRCSAGARWGTVLDFCKKNNLGGLEAFTSLSGTAGGAVFMNACCFSLAACDRLLTVRYLDTQKNEIFTYKTDKKDWGYKKSPFQPAPEKLKGGVGGGGGPPPGGEGKHPPRGGGGGRSPPNKKKKYCYEKIF